MHAPADRKQPKLSADRGLTPSQAVSALTALGVPRDLASRLEARARRAKQNRLLDADGRLLVMRRLAREGIKAIRTGAAS